MDFATTLKIAAAGLAAQGARLRVISQNLANAESTAETPGGDPYRRQTITFRQALDRATGARLVEAGPVRRDPSDFRMKLDPSNPAADADGYVKLPNVNPLIEIMDMREAQRSYQANLSIIETAKSMIARTLDILRA